MSDVIPIGVAVVGHGSTASQLLAAARAILPAGALDHVIAIDAGLGETPILSETMCTAIAKADRGRGVMVLVDLFGASPCQCARKQGLGHPLAIVSGLTLAMLLKLATMDRTRVELGALAQACADAGHRSIAVTADSLAEEVSASG
jgi:PTS system mannose-specific IIA component